MHDNKVILGCKVGQLIGGGGGEGIPLKWSKGYAQICSKAYHIAVNASSVLPSSLRNY